MHEQAQTRTSYEIERGYGTAAGDRKLAREIVAQYNADHGTDLRANGPEFKRVRRALSHVTQARILCTEDRDVVRTGSGLKLSDECIDIIESTLR